MQESNEMGEALLHLTQETEQMKTLIRKLEESTEKSPRKPADDTLIADINLERRLWQEEKEKLLTEAETLKSEVEILKRDSTDAFRNNDILKLEVRKLTQEIEMLKEENTCLNEKHKRTISEDRVVHLFGKYMRAESYRKALAWQKRYLLVVISGYEDSEEETWTKINKMAHVRKDVKRRQIRKKKGRSLKGVAMSVVAVLRMQFLVRRWCHGRIAGVNNWLGPETESTGPKSEFICITISLINRV